MSPTLPGDRLLLMPRWSSSLAPPAKDGCPVEESKSAGLIVPVESMIGMEIQICRRRERENVVGFFGGSQSHASRVALSEAEKRLRQQQRASCESKRLPTTNEVVKIGKGVGAG